MSGQLQCQAQVVAYNVREAPVKTQLSQPTFLEGSRVLCFSWGSYRQFNLSKFLLGSKFVPMKDI